MTTEPSLSPGALFSPSKARQELTQAREWSYVDAWLKTTCQGKLLPSFERNETTLKALLALAAFNERRDEERELVGQVEDKALQELRDAAQSDPDADMLRAIDDNLTPMGRGSLDSMAALSVALGTTSTDPIEMAAGVMDLTTTEFSLEQQASRITALQQSLEAEHVRLQKLLNELNSPALTTPASLTQKTTEYTNATKHITAKRQEYRERISNLASTWSAGQVSIPQVIAAEEEVRRLQKSLREIEGKVQAFHGLPPSRTLALQEIERMGREVERLRQRRDGLFEGLVEDDTEAPRQ